MTAPVTRVPDDFVPEQADSDALEHAVRCLLRERAQLAEQSAAREKELSERLAARKRQVEELEAIVGAGRTGDPRDPIELRLEIRRLRRDMADQQVILDNLEERSRELERARDEQRRRARDLEDRSRELERERDEQRQRARDLEHALEPFALAVPIAPAFGYGAHLRPDGQWSHSVGGLRAGIAPVHWIRAAVTYVAGTEDDVARLVELAEQRERAVEAPARCPTPGCPGPGPDVADRGPGPEDAVVIACPSCGRGAERIPGGLRPLCGGCGGAGRVHRAHVSVCTSFLSFVSARGEYSRCGHCGKGTRPCALCRPEEAAEFSDREDAPTTGEGSKT